MRATATATAALTLLLCMGCSSTGEARYLGKQVGALSELHHAVRGRLYAVDSRTLYLHDFHYDGEGPAAYFYVGTSKTPNASGATRLRDERGSGSPLRRYRGEGITLSLPDNKTLKDVSWFSVWCDEYSINFGSVEIPRDLEYPKPVKVAALRGVHGVSSDPIVIVDAQTLLVPNFSYDGEAPDAKFWVGRGDKPSPQGIRIPDENGKEVPLRKYDKKTIVLTLPGELTVFDIGHFAVWCEAFTVNFGHVSLPASAALNVPPSLKMLGVSPQSRNKALVGEATSPRPRKPPARLQRLDATTYRPPHLRAGPSADLHTSAVHAQHRRDYTSDSKDQIIPTQSKENFEILRSEEVDHKLYQNEDLLPIFQRHQLQHEFGDQRRDSNQNYLTHNVQHQNQYNPNHQPDQLTEQLLYQQQFYEQQRQALQQQLQQYHPTQFNQGPVQYRLLPNQESVQGRSYQSGLDPIPRSRSQ